MKRLVLLANAFPYGTGETFLETEVGYLRGFDAVHVVSLSVRPQQRRARRSLPDGITVHPIRFRSRVFYALAAARVLVDRNFYRELRHLRGSGRLTLGRIVTLLVFLSRAHHEARAAARALRAAGAEAGDQVVFYSYRFNYQPYLAWLLRHRFPGAATIARAHRADLYEELAPGGYLPLRQHTVAHLDRIYLIADHGLAYLQERFPGAASKMSVARLGTTDHGLNPSSSARASLRLVSCSTITPVKRLGLLVQALALSDQPVEWEHFGEGPLRDELRQDADRLLPAGVRLTLRGFVANADLVEDYARQPRHVLINVSSSEGVPVSIMEALSAGIPVIATNVGGTREIVTTGVNGILLPADPSPEQIHQAIARIATLPDAEYAALRAGARRIWELACAAERLYPAFAQEVVDMIPSPA
ncbi:MAG: glycosyltransferase [Propionibacteriaceae bacterium]|nr:glycosyltransferase [Propionibacteriaceae bacterium]